MERDQNGKVKRDRQGKVKGQDCDTAWPFETITKSAALQDPDLVIHVGDYRYFQEGASADTWSYWQKDMIVPARDLLVQAPWVLSRGNHEQCSGGWYGIGYSFLFGPTDAACSQLPDLTWHFDVAPGGFDPAGVATNAHRFIMIDSANDSPKGLSDRFEAALKTSNQESTWWI